MINKQSIVGGIFLPELPEVETIRRDLEKLIIGKVIKDVKLHYAGFVKYPTPTDFVSRVKDKKVQGIGRRGKYLFIHLSDQYNLIIHLRMTGRIIYSNTKLLPDKHTHGVFQFKEGSELHFHDVRKFGTMWLVNSEEISFVSGLKMLGPEPLEKGFTLEFLTVICKKSRSKIKSLLLSQKAVAGIGNIYADEALFRAGVDPSREGNTLTDREINNLWESVRFVLEEGIKARGTSISDYVDGSGKQGDFQNFLKVYGRKNEPCYVCGKVVLRKKIAGRSSHFCSECQR